MYKYTVTIRTVQPSSPAPLAARGAFYFRRFCGVLARRACGGLRGGLADAFPNH